MDTMITKTLDLSNLLCPMPVIRTQKAIRNMQKDEVLEVICTDPGTQQDIPAWCRIYQHELIRQSEDNGRFIFSVKIVHQEKASQKKPAVEEW